MSRAPARTPRGSRLLTETLARLGPLAQQIVQGTLQRALEAKAEQFLADQADALSSPPAS